MVAGTAPAATAEARRGRIWTGSFVAMCASIFLAYGHYGLFTPTLPLYLHDLHLSEVEIGLVLSAFSVTAVAVRPSIGYWADAWSAPGMAGVGMLILGATSIILLAPWMGIIVAANAMRGIGWAGTNTGANTLVAHIAPSDRRGEASGFYSMFQSAASALFPFCALWLLHIFTPGYALVFVLAGVLGLLAAAISRLVTYRPVKAPAPARAGRANALRMALMIDRQVLPVTLLQAILAMGQPAAGAFVPLFAQHIGLDLRDVGWYFVASGVAAVIGRGPLGRLSDRFGRGPSIVAGFLATATSFVVLATASGVPALVAAGVIYSLGFSSAAAAVLALAFDRANPARRGTAMATFSLGSQLGIGLGSTLWGGLIELAGYSGMFLAAAGAAALGIACMLAVNRSTSPA